MSSFQIMIDASKVSHCLIQNKSEDITNSLQGCLNINSELRNSMKEVELKCLR